MDCPPERAPLDLFTISGSSLVSSDRNYTVAMKSQDRTLADWAATCGGSLAMAAHNVHVMQEAKKPTRENYRTRRNDRIHHLTFHSANNFAVVKDESWKTRNTEAYSSSSSETSSSNSDEERRPSEYQNYGWNSFGSYKIPKHPKSSKPCPKSRRKNPSIIERMVNVELDSKTSVVTEFPDEILDAVPFIQSEVINPVNNNEIGDEDDLNLDFLEDIDIGEF